MCRCGWRRREPRPCPPLNICRMVNQSLFCLGPAALLLLRFSPHQHFFSFCSLVHVLCSAQTYQFNRHLRNYRYLCSVADTYHFDTDPGSDKFCYGSGSRPNFDTDPDPGKNYTDPDQDKKGVFNGFCLIRIRII